MRSSHSTKGLLLAGLLSFCTAVPNLLPAQEGPETFVSFGYGYEPQWQLHLLSADAYHAWPVTRNKRLMLGGGVRYNFQGGADPVRFKAVESENTTEVEIDGVHVHALALFLEATYRLADRLELGFNLDVVGFAFGSTYQSANPSALGTIDLQPEGVSLLLAGENDLGALNSEFFVAYRVAERIWLRAALSHTVINYEDTAHDTRYQRFFNYPTVGIQYQLGRRDKP